MEAFKNKLQLRLTQLLIGSLAILFLSVLPLFGQLPDTSGNTTQNSATLSGFAEVEWGMSYQAIRDMYVSLATNPQSEEEIEIVNEKKDESLLIKRNGIFYLYRFYHTPQIVLDSRPKTEVPASDQIDPATGKPKHNNPGSLYSVGVSFNYVPSDDIRKKLEDKYGKPKKESLDDKKLGGAVLWDLSDQSQFPSKGGFVVQWKESYKQAAFTRRIDYFSSGFKDMIVKEYKEFFSVQEIKTLRDLIP